MYTRCPSIANIFQKAILLKDTKCNKIIHRQLRSESLVPKTEIKLKPMKRCFSGAPNTKNSMQRTRIIQGVGYTRKAFPKKTFFVPKFPIQMVQPKQPFSVHQPMPQNLIQNDPEIIENAGVSSVNCQPSNENNQNCGKITIVIDKKEICNSSSANEDIQIHVTTKPEEAEVCSRKCNCYLHGEESKKSRIQNMAVIEQNPNPNPVQQNFSNDFPRQRNVYGIPLRSFITFDDGRSKMEAKKSRSMSNFPAMRKMITPNTFNRIQPNIGQLPMKMQRSLSKTIETARKNKYPVGRASVPRMSSFQGQNPSILTQKAFRNNVINNISPAGLRSTIFSPGPVNSASRANINSTYRPPPIPIKQRSAVSHGNSLIHQKQLVQRQPPLMMLNKGPEPRQMNRHGPKRQLPQINLRRKPNLVKAQQIVTKNKFPESSGRFRTPFIAPNFVCQPTSNIQLPTKQRFPMLIPAHQQPPHVLLKRRSVLRPMTNPYQQMNRQPSHRRISVIPAIQMRSLPQRNVNSEQNLAHRTQPKLVPNFRNVTKPRHLLPSMIPVRKNLSMERTLRRNDFPQLNRSHTGSVRKTPVLPFTHSQPHSNNLTNSMKQRKSIVDLPQKRSDIRRMTENKLQSSLPVAVTNQQNQIEKYVERPKSIQTVGRPYPNQAVINPIQRLSGIPNSSVRLQQMPQFRRKTPPMNGQKSLPREQFNTHPNKLKDASTNAPQLPAVTPNTNLKNSNPAVLFYAPDKLKLVNLAVPRLTDEEGVIVKMLYVQLTDTDAQILSSKHDGPYKLTQPTIVGKSGSGLVVDVGKQVQAVKIGDKVSVKGMSCGKCAACENDNEIICERVSVTDKLGILKRFHAVPAKFVTKLPDTVHPIDGAMIDELSSAIRACKKSTVTAGDNVLVLGGKSLGLWTALAAKSMGATNVCLADSRPLVLDQAKKVGIERVFLINRDSPVANTSKSISEYMDGQNPRIVFDCSGSPLTNEIAINTSTIGGKVVLMKNSTSNKPIVLSDAVHREIDILSSQHGNNESERAALQFLASGKVKLNGIDSSFFDISNVDAAFGLLNSGTISNVFVQPGRPDDENNAKKISS